VNLLLDIVERLRIAVLLGIGVAAAVCSLVIAFVFGGSVAVWVLVVGTVAVLASGGLLALRVHLARLPLELSDVALSNRIDGHRAFGFRTRLGRGRLMREATARVRFLPDGGDPVDLEPILGAGDALVGSWTVVVIDREGQCGDPGRFEVTIEAGEGSKRWSASHTYDAADIQTGRFSAPADVRNGRLALAHDAWDKVR
jgi:hypothetical protein